jgi:hypothetical protein
MPNQIFYQIMTFKWGHQYVKIHIQVTFYEEKKKIYRMHLISRLEYQQITRNKMM